MILRTSVFKSLTEVLLLLIMIFLFSHQVLGIERRNKSENDEFFFSNLLYIKSLDWGAGEGGGAAVVNLLGDASTIA